MARIHINSIETLDENPLENFVKFKPKTITIFKTDKDKLKLAYKEKRTHDRTNINILEF